jgi:predicted transposase YdaD
MAQIDIGSKQTIHLYNQAWLEWLLKQPVTVQEELSGEFRFLARYSDSLLRVKLGRRKPFLALTELQWNYQKRMPERLMAYGALARHKYKLEVFITVVYFVPPKKGLQIPEVCHHDCFGQEAHQDFNVITLWNLNATDLLALNNPALLPFIPFTNGGKNKTVLRRCLKQIRTHPHAEELETFLGALASHVFDIDWLRQLFRWNMDIIRDSPLFRELFAEERQTLFEQLTEERQKRLDKERELTQERQNSLSTVLRLRFGKVPTEFGKRVNSLDSTVLQSLTQTALTVNTLAEFETALANTLAKTPKRSLVKRVKVR